MRLCVVCKSLKQSASKTLIIIRCLKHAGHKLKTVVLIPGSIKFRVIKHDRTQRRTISIH